MIYMGIDASTKSSGLSVFDEDKLICHDCLKASSTDVIKRISKIIEQLDKAIEKYKPDIIVLEEVRPQDNLQGPGNIQTHRVLMWLQAAINFLCHEKYPNIKIDYIYPNEWRSWLKIKTGAGVKREALKEADIAWVKDNFGLELNDDEADAIGIICGYKIVVKENIPKSVSTKKPGCAW